MLRAALMILAEADPVSWPEWMENSTDNPVWVISSLVLTLIIAVVAFGDTLSGMLSLFGIEAPFGRSVPSESDRQKVRHKFLQILKREVDYRLETSLHERVKLDLYMEDQRQQVGKPKTEIVPPDTPKDSSTEMSLLNRVFRSFRRQTDQPIPLESTQKIVDVFDQADIQGKLLILGEPGAGKTTELLHLAQDLLKRAAGDNSFPIPLILELSVWDESKSVEQWIAAVVKKQYGIPKSITQHWLQHDDILLLLDGLDELGLTNQQRCIGTINAFLANRARYGLVICCRREEYETGQVQLDRLNGAVYLELLRENQIQLFFEKLNRPHIWKHIRESSTLQELARNPLFLSMLVVAYQGKPIINETELFDAFIVQKLHEDRGTNVYPLNKRTDPQQTWHYMAWLATHLRNNHETEFFIENLQPSLINLDSKEQRLYGLIVALIYGLICGLAGTLLGGLLGSLVNSSAYGLVSGLIIGLICLFFGIFIGFGGWSIKPIRFYEKMNFSFFNALRGGLAEGLFSGLSIGLLIGLMSLIFIDDVDEALFIGLFSSLLFGLIGGLSGGLRSGISSSPIAEKNVPNQGIWKSFWNSTIEILILGLACAIFLGLFWGLMGDLKRGLVFGFGFGLLNGLNEGRGRGLGAVIKHVALRIVLTINGYAPWNYARFLDHAVELRFMQRVGGRYRFVHDLLRKHFAAMHLD